MKKFGTPIAAGPGNANENDGFAGVGTPPAPVFAGGFGCLTLVAVLWEPRFDFAFRLDDEECLPAGALPEDELCFEERELPGAGVVWPVVVLGVVVVVLGVVVVVLGVVVVVELVWQDSETACTGPVTGSLIDDSGVPGGTLTVKFSFCPETSVTVTTHVSADAAGRSPNAPSANTDPAVATAITSFRLLSTLA